MPSSVMNLKMIVLFPIELIISFQKAVKENYRRQGHGEAMLEAAIKNCRTRNIGRITLHVDPSRTPAMSLYKKHGFQIDSMIKSYYSSDRDAYRMYLDFDTD